MLILTRMKTIQYSGNKMSLTTLTIYAKKLAKIIPAYTDMLGLFYLIRSSSCSKPRGGG